MAVPRRADAAAVDPNRYPHAFAGHLDRQDGSTRIVAHPVVTAGRFTAHGIVRFDDTRLEPFPGDPCAQAELARFCAGFAKAGPSYLSSIDGAFAVALYDREAQALILVRDALGQAPLYFRHHADGVAWADRPLALADGRGSTVRLDRLADFLLDLGEPGPASFFDGIERVGPGDMVTFHADGRVDRARWWTPSTSAGPGDRSSALGELRARLARRMAGLGARHPAMATHLTAGLDSSLVTAVAATQGLRPIAYTAAPATPIGRSDGLISDESPLAAATAAALDITHRRVGIAPTDWLETLDAMLPTLQRPLRNFASLPWLDTVARAAAGDGATALAEGSLGNLTTGWSGEGQLATYLRSGRLDLAWRAWRDYRRYHRRLGLGWGWRTLAGLAPAPLIRWRFTRELDRQLRRTFLRPESPVARAARRRWRRRPPPPWSGGSIIRDGADRLRLFVDSGSADLAAAIAARHDIAFVDPYATRSIAEATLAMTEPDFVQRGEPRSVARALMPSAVPAAVRDQRLRGAQDWWWHESTRLALPRAKETLAWARRQPALAETVDLDRLDQCLADWDALACHAEQGQAVIRAIGALRFAWWAAGVGEAA